MTIVELLLLAVSLAMDAFAVSVCAGISEKKHSLKKALRPAVVFAVFQTVMPVLGYALGSAVAVVIGAVGPYIAFLLLAFIGGKMIWDSFKGGDDDDIDASNTAQLMLLAVATSIDALAVGVTFSLVGANVWTAAPTIGAVTLAICLAGFYLGGRIGGVFKRRAVFAGGAVLILLGIKTLLEHLL